MSPHPYQSLAPGLRDDFFRNVARNLIVAIELHGVHRATLGLRPQITDVTEHLRQRNLRLDFLDAVDVIHGLDGATTRREVAHDIAHVLFRSTDLDGHDRLEKNRLGTLGALLQDHRTGDLERHFRRVDFVVGAVKQRRLDANHRVAGENTGLHGVLNTGVDRRNVFARDTPTSDLVDELVRFLGVGGQRLEIIRLQHPYLLLSQLRLPCYLLNGMRLQEYGHTYHLKYL